MQTTFHSFTSPVHPAILGAYVQSDIGGREKAKRVLVLETNSSDTTTSFEETLMDILADLPTIQHEVEARVGHLDRVDIRLM